MLLRAIVRGPKECGRADSGSIFLAKHYHELTLCLNSN